MARPGQPDKEYADYLLHLYGNTQEDHDDSELSHPTTTCTTSVAPTHERRPPPRLPSTAERLSRNRAAKRAATDVTLYNHLSTMYHMNRRIYEMYSKAGLLGQEGGSTHRSQHGASPSRSGSRCSERPAVPAYGVPPPSVAGVSRALSPTRIAAYRGPASRPATAPSSSDKFVTHQQSGVAVRVQHAAQQAQGCAGGRPDTVPAPTSFVKRHVQNTAVALKTAILDEICEHRIYEGARLRALFRSYLSLNAGETFLPTLAAVIEELRTELGVA